MIATVTPSSLTGLGLDPRAARDAVRTPEPQGQQQRVIQDQVSVAEAALSWRSARESVRQALADLDLSLAAGRDAANLVGQIAEAARSGDDEAVQSLLTQLGDTVNGAISAGAAALTGAPLRVQMERDVPPFEVAGLDLRLKDQAGDALLLTRNADASPATVNAAEDSLTRIQFGLDRMRGAAQRLETHDGFLAAAEAAAAGGVRGDLDAESARLLALQVRQGLSESGASIASARPDSVLGLFKG